MARKNVASSENIDWYLISIDRLKKIGLVVFLALLAGGIWFYISHERGNPRTLAEGAIADARQALNSLAASKDFTAHHADFDRAQKKLDDASNFFNGKKYQEAQTAAFESQTISRAAVSGGGDQENDARFLTLEGDVEYQKGSSGDWLRADLRTPLVNGDWVKTHDNASAELMFQNGSLYTIGPNALLEIYSTMNAQTARKTNSVQMKFGSVEVATVNDQSTVRTPGSQVVVDSESTTQVGVNKADAQTSVMGVRGTASVAPAAGGEAVKIGAGDKINATSTGALGGVKKLLMPPALSNPPDNQVFSIALDTQVTFQWQAQQRAVAYQLQVSRSRLFSTLEINSRRTKLEATAKVESEGIFYWRVASIGPDGDPGPFSPFHRFRVSGSGKSAPSATGDTQPPTLVLKAPFNIGGQFYIIEGQTEPGATVFVNDEEADVETNGHFKKLVSFNKVGQNTVVVKAVDAAGNQTVKSQVVLVEE
ncbi:MAG TPA: FecR domain-containing protein [Thermoanaerobaculia bacterium]|nr:FecR domain-containing protein [Thermoanaerobaculia bacterium]